ncbi:g3641 [Coccomyxa elongata]
MWQWLAGSRRGPLYRWQERAEEETLGRDDRGSSGGARKRRLREATIPHIIHQVFLDGEAALEEEERKEERAGKEFRRFNHRWRDSCQKFHPGWTHMFWDNQAAEELLLERYPWFMDTWRSYPRVVHRGDAIRPFLLHAYGGLYMDVDVECFDATDKMIDGFDLVLQLEDSGNKSLNNAVMAGAPGLEIWAIMHGLLQQRAPHLVAMHNKTRSQRDMSHAVLYATGPWLLRDAFKEFSGEAGDLAAGYAGAHAVKGTHVMVYALGQWFEPCEWSDLSCHALVDIAAVSGTPLRGIVGHHKNAGTWLKGYGEAEPSPLSLKLRLRLRADTWATLAMGAALLVAMAAVLCMRLFRRRRRWRSSSASNLANGGHRRVTSLNSFGSLASQSGTELTGLERRALSYGSRLSSLGSAYGGKAKLARPASQQKFSILNEIEKGEL